ncbi:MAG TPA: hypothetical protein VG269_19320 [Tepidisphaeraceae bacterium]|jgi:hypothetical protein|nr:hypothetical protein [Tepidisphaeraceae bacterium]
MASLGSGERRHYLQVIYVFSPEDVVFVIHAMPLTDRQKQQYRRRAR